MGDYYATRRGVLSTEAVIPRARLEELERKERAHDAYMRATKKMRVRQDAVIRHHNDPRTSAVPRARDAGWLAAMSEFSEAVIEA